MTTTSSQRIIIDAHISWCGPYGPRTGVVLAGPIQQQVQVRIDGESRSAWIWLHEVSRVDAPSPRPAWWRRLITEDPVRDQRTIHAMMAAPLVLITAAALTWATMALVRWSFPHHAVEAQPAVERERSGP